MGYARGLCLAQLSGKREIIKRYGTIDLNGALNS